MKTKEEKKPKKIEAFDFTGYWNEKTERVTRLRKIRNMKRKIQGKTTEYGK